MEIVVMGHKTELEKGLKHILSLKMSGPEKEIKSLYNLTSMQGIMWPVLQSNAS